MQNVSQYHVNDLIEKLFLSMFVHLCWSISNRQSNKIVLSPALLLLESSSFEDIEAN